MAQHNDLGKRGEVLAAQFLVDKGYEILDENWVHGKSEVDLIAYINRQIIFVEVKSRTSVSFGMPEDFVSNAKQKQMELDAVTLDRVICGEQQPESDHFMEMLNSNTGSDEDIHWREARDNGWFSYLMKTQTDTVAQIRIVYKGLPNRDATVWVNDVKVGTLTSVVSNELSISEFALPQALQGEKQLRVKIGTATSKGTVRIYEVRLVKNAEPTK